VHLRDTIRRAAGETIDLKPYEADMRHLLDTYVEASEPRKISPFEEIGLLDMIVNLGIADAIDQKLDDIKGNKDAVAETIENNVRSVINTKNVTDPVFYERMSTLLQEVIEMRRAKALEYEDYLQKIADIVEQIQSGQQDDLPEVLDSRGKQAIYNILVHTPGSHNEAAEVEVMDEYNKEELAKLAVAIHKAVIDNRPDSWRGDQAKEETIKRSIFDVVGNISTVEKLFPVVSQNSEY